MNNEKHFVVLFALMMSLFFGLMLTLDTLGHKLDTMALKINAMAQDSATADLTPETSTLVQIYRYFTVTSENNVVTEIRIDVDGSTTPYSEYSCDAYTPDDNGHTCILVNHTDIQTFIQNNIDGKG